MAVGRVESFSGSLTSALGRQNAATADKNHPVRRPREFRFVLGRTERKEYVNLISVSLSLRNRGSAF